MYCRRDGSHTDLAASIANCALNHRPLCHVCSTAPVAFAYGRCGISDLIAISEREGVKLFVATGGTIARRIVKDSKPDAIIAVACERDLSGGIVDTFPLPVIGILNERPFGPCLDTRVDMKKVEEAITFFAGGLEQDEKNK